MCIILHHSEAFLIFEVVQRRTPNSKVRSFVRTSYPLRTQPVCSDIQKVWYRSEVRAWRRPGQFRCSDR
jgi:hypothetical protein